MNNNKTTTEELFFQLLQVTVGNRDRLTITPTSQMWEEIYGICKKQTLLGVVFKGVERLPREQLPPFPMVRRWYVNADRIRTRNEEVNRGCARLCALLKERGMQSCVIKGQSNIKNYPVLPPNEEGKVMGLGEFRVPGDIDVWAWTESGRVSDVIEDVLKLNPRAKATYHHIDCNYGVGREVEVHYRPSWMSAPWRNRVLQDFCRCHRGEKEIVAAMMPDGKEATFNVPSIAFDAVYQMVHIYRHLFSEGIGLRQIMDYYMVVCRATPEIRREAYGQLCRLGMRRFAAAMMWVMREVFDDSEGIKEWMLCEPSERDGRFLLVEIMLAGNFGHADERYTIKREDSAWRWGLMKLRRNMKFLTYYPEEVICEPFFRVVHWIWRTFRLWK